MISFSVRVVAVGLFCFALSGQTRYEFSGPDSRTKYELSADEVYVSTTRVLPLRSISAVEPLSWGGAIVRGAGSRPELLAGLHTVPGSRVAPVFYDRSALPSAERLARLSPEVRAARLANARRFLTNHLLVKFDGARSYEALSATQPVHQTPSLIEGWTMVGYTTPGATLAAVDWLVREGGWEFVPVFAKKHTEKQSGTLNRPVNDPLYPRQWHLGTDAPNLRMGASWDLVTGRGINIAVIDDGLDVNHEDLKANAYPIEGGFHRNFNDGPENDPSPLTTDDNHGTNCAGLIAAVGFNNIGVTGVAPAARLMGLRLIAGDAGDDATAAALLWQPAGIMTHVSSNSWGPSDDGADPGRTQPLQAAALRKGAEEGRDGLGIVYVISAGNGRDDNDDSSYDEFSGSRFAISVGAVNRNGEQSSFSESGMSVAVSAFGGEYNPPGVLWTTNNMGAASLAELRKKFETSTAPVNYSDAFNGTSAAAPQVSGAVALMLERNPRLGHRDVKEILIRSARRDMLKGGDEFRTNGAGIAFSHSFGAGLINVAGAVELATDWRNLGQLVFTDATSREALAIPDGDLEGVTYPFDFSGPPIRVEHVELVVDVEHPLRGDLGFAIISPSGMVSVAEPRPNDEGEDFENYRFTSVRHWGETSTGTWRVKIIDTSKGDEGAVGRVTLRLFGTAR